MTCETQTVYIFPVPTLGHIDGYFYYFSFSLTYLIKKFYSHHYLTTQAHESEHYENTINIFF